MTDQLDEHPLAGQDPPVPRRDGRIGDVLIWLTIALGVVLLFAGYWGASDSTDPGEQLPYLASGTVPGVALVIVGCALLMRREHERDRAEIRGVTERFDAVLGWLASASDPPEEPPTTIQPTTGQPTTGQPPTTQPETVSRS